MSHTVLKQFGPSGVGWGSLGMVRTMADGWERRGGRDGSWVFLSTRVVVDSGSDGVVGIWGLLRWVGRVVGNATHATLQEACHT